MGDIIDEALIEGPGIHPSLPIIDDCIAEAEGLGLHVRLARGDPGGAGGAQILFGGFGQECVDGAPHCFRRGERIGVPGLRDIGIDSEHVLRRRLRDGGGDPKEEADRSTSDRPND